MRYLEGDDGHAGARDATPPADGRFAIAPLQLRFAGESTRWGGGVCFVDPDAAASAHVRAWDVTAEQFEDVFAQENRRPVGSPFDWETVRTAGGVIGDSWYARVVPVDLPFASPDQPAMTFTWSTPLPLNPPSAAYRDTIVNGLAEHPDLTPSEIDAYLDAAVIP
jgi:hypothetical protein